MKTLVLLPIFCFTVCFLELGLASLEDISIEQAQGIEQKQQAAPTATQKQYTQFSDDADSVRVSSFFQAQQAERLAKFMRPNKDLIMLFGANEKLKRDVWEVPCDPTFYKEAYGVIPGCTPVHNCHRIVQDDFMTKEDADEFMVDVKRAMMAIPRQGNKTMLNPAVSHEMLTKRGQLIYEIYGLKIRLEIMREFGCADVFHSGSLVTKIESDPDMSDGLQLEADHGYWQPHVDKANVPTYDYTAIIYLNHVKGGEFAFIDEDADRLVETKQGRLVMFTSGIENLHMIRNMTKGERFALSYWFTCSKEHKFNLTEFEVMLQESIAKNAAQDFVQPNIDYSMFDQVEEEEEEQYQHFRHGRATEEELDHRRHYDVDEERDDHHQHHRQHHHHHVDHHVEAPPSKPMITPPLHPIAAQWSQLRPDDDEDDDD